MSRRDERFDRMRGRHKKDASRETRRWNDGFLPQLPEPEPEEWGKPQPVPAWMDSATAEKLLALRRRLEHTR